MKLTDEQVENWRNVLTGMIGPYALMMPKEDIQLFKDRMQNKIDSVMHSWEVRIKLGEKENNVSSTHWMEFDWETVSPEPKKPFASKIQMTSKCEELLKKYPAIQCIKICIADSPVDMYLFHR